MFLYKLSEPSGAPTNIVKIVQSSCSVRVTWDPPPKSSWNGFIKEYAVTLKVNGFPHDVFSSNERKCFIDDLSPGTEYSVQVAACTSAGPGKWSDPSKFTTHESGMFLTQSLLVTLFDINTWYSLS